ncbi:RICIN domain-containing protein [Gallaecimonas pentaromativorans]|uniref:Pectate lyase n=1 Tax=Gallaecimonas pentaromativorans TaxID=584787 RepID=A0A3N1PJ29_9GAMM|nr:RICIN domain-containing protein [Gallaecimonas pentaromativorans]ROQ28603.1 pectate lyase [Gallaecimonas pentaromativorans]
MYRFFTPKGWLTLAWTLLALASPAALADNCNQMPVSGQLYSVINRGSGLALDVNTSDTSGAPNVITYEYWGGTNQQFYFNDLGNGYWSIQSAYNGQVLDVLNSSSSDGANIIVFDNWSGNNQQWQLKASSSGGFNIVSKLTGKSVTVAGATNASNVYQNSDAGISSQRWYINPVSGSCGGSGSGSASSPVGFAAISGSDGLATTTGGGNASAITVTSCSALASALGSSSAAVIQIPDNTTINCHSANRTVAACPLDCAQWNDPDKTWYRVPVGSQSCSELGSPNNNTVNVVRNETTLTVRSNKTLVGLGSGARVIGGSFNLGGARNVIIRNLTIEDINPALVEAGDGISLDGSSHIWIDHVAFNKISDGFVDMVNSRNVTLSWNRFYGYNPQVCANQHWYTNLVDDSQVTFHHNFWDRAAGRNPKIDGASSQVHLFNNYWKNITYFAVGADHGAQVLLQNNYFENSAKPHWNQGSGYFSAAGNTYTGVSATDQYRDSGATVFTPPYLYSPEPASGLGSEVDGGTGPQ